MGCPIKENDFCVVLSLFAQARIDRIAVPNFFYCGGCVMWDIIVDKDKCSGDEECVNACPAQVFEMQDGKAEPVNADECLGCETCVEVCPEAAITVTEM